MYIRRLSFTRLMDAFSLRDRDIYDIWTQHKAGVLTKFYTIDLIKRTIPYFEKGKIEECVLLGNVGHYIKEVNGLRNGMKRVKTLEQENKELRTEYTTMKTFYKEEMDKLWNKMKEMEEDMVTMFQDKDYNKAFYEAGISKITEKEKHSKIVRKPKK